MRESIPYWQKQAEFCRLKAESKSLPGNQDKGFLYCISHVERIKAATKNKTCNLIA